MYYKESGNIFNSKYTQKVNLISKELRCKKHIMKRCVSSKMQKLP